MVVLEIERKLVVVIVLEGKNTDVVVVVVWLLWTETINLLR